MCRHIPLGNKFAIGIGGSYGRGAMVCAAVNTSRAVGLTFDAALEGGSFGLQLGGAATDFVLLHHDPRGAKAHSEQ